MVSLRTPPTLGIGAALVVLGLLLAPYLLVPEASAVRTYYGAGTVTPLVAGLFALVSIVIFAAGREDRTDPAVAAGAGLVFGAFGTLVALVWTLTIPNPDSLVGSLGSVRGIAATFLEYHRYLVVGATAAVAASGGWFARKLGLL
ncbi:hypothetical protein BRC71_05580 [Halobacteriales archaeon QH_7_65_31]|nr:MAG: hypothetical protein BRC71_05580 [Halobacteriales archaeon QH_7_65_31]